MVVSVAVAVRVHVLGSIERESIGHASVHHVGARPFRRTICAPGSVGVIVAPPVTIGVVPLGGVGGKRVSGLIDVKLIVVNLEEVIVASAVAVNVDPLGAVRGERVGAVNGVPCAGHRVGVTVTVAVKATEAVHV